MDDADDEWDPPSPSHQHPGHAAPGREYGRTSATRSVEGACQLVADPPAAQRQESPRPRCSGRSTRRRIQKRQSRKTSGFCRSSVASWIFQPDGMALREGIVGRGSQAPPRLGAYTARGVGAGGGLGGETTPGVGEMSGSVIVLA